MKKISVILPCAGSGTRLGLDYPKELYEIYGGFKLIDFSLNHIAAFRKNNPESEIKIIVVTRPSKTSVTEHVRNKISGIKIVQVYFNDRYVEWAGSVYSAKKHFEEYSIVLLPDSAIRLSENNVYYDKNGRTLIDIMAETLGKCRTVFAYNLCNDAEMLQRLGSLYVYGTKIHLFQDKPDDNVRNYNAFWTAYGFRKNCGKSLYRFLSESIMHSNPQYEKQPFYPAAGIETSGYYDLGTWESINAFLKTENKKDYMNS